VCLAIPLRIERFADTTHVVAGDPGAELRVDVSLVPQARVGDYVIVHAGFAIQVVDDDEAAEQLELFRQIAEAGAAGT
jgi:hydrogenase expression/formation protein HypC